MYTKVEPLCYSLPQQERTNEGSEMPEDNVDKQPWKKRRLIRGRWRDPEDDKTSMPRVEKTVSVKLLEAELAEFDAQIARIPIKRNRALRIAARRIAGFLETDAATVDELKAITRQLSGIARNINQMAKAANRTHDIPYKAFLEERALLGKEIAKLDQQMQTILNVSIRRTDGLKLLEDAIK